ncbi:hypothetical protein ABBQ38_013920 [Trebouxia sp. C0009 RCD-2024]
MILSKVLQAESLLQVTKKLPRRGVGTKLQRLSWKEDSFWTLTAVKPSIDGNHGVASGVLTWKGDVQSEKPKRINGVLKKVWRHMQPSTRVEWRTPPKPAEQEASV